MNRFYILLFSVFIFACSKNSPSPQCNYLPDISVSITISLSGPYHQLNFNENTVLIPNEGIAGIYVSRSGGQFRAFDAADPAHPATECSFLEQVGAVGTCQCTEANKFSLSTGISLNPDVSCIMKEYRVESIGSNQLLISSN